MYKRQLLTRIQFPNGLEIDWYNTHTQASYRSQKQRSLVREKQIASLLDFMNEHSDGSRPIVLTGDLNINEDNNGYKAIMNAEFTDVMRTLKPNKELYPLTTLRKSNPLRELKLDHVFLKPGQNHQWLPEHSQSEIFDLALSDHRGVLSKIAFEPKGTKRCQAGI